MFLLPLNAAEIVTASLGGCWLRSTLSHRLSWEGTRLGLGISKPGSDSQDSDLKPRHWPQFFSFMTWATQLGLTWAREKQRSVCSMGKGQWPECWLPLLRGKLTFVWSKYKSLRHVVLHQLLSWPRLPRELIRTSGRQVEFFFFFSDEVKSSAVF